MIKTRYTSGLIIIVFMLISGIGFGQETVEVRDLEVWSSIGLKYKPNKNWTLGFSEQLRLKKNASEVDQYFTQFKAMYRATKDFDLGGGFRLIRDNDNQGNVQGYENHLRIHLDVNYKYKTGAFSLKTRLRYQNKNELGVSTDQGDSFKQNIRLKTSMTYNIKGWKLDPKFSAEIFNKIRQADGNGLSKYRLTLGTEYKIKKLGEIGVFYRLERELNEAYPKTTYILGLNYTHTFKRKKSQSDETIYY